MIEKQKIKNLSIKELVELIINNYHKKLRILLENISNDLDIISKKYDIEYLLELYKQFKYELLMHIDREEIRFFSELLNLDFGENINTQRIKEFLKFQKIEHNELSNYLILGEELIKKIIVKDIDLELEKFKKNMDRLYVFIKDVIYIEDEFLNILVELKLKTQ